MDTPKSSILNNRNNKPLRLKDPLLADSLLKYQFNAQFDIPKPTGKPKRAHSAGRINPHRHKSPEPDADETAANNKKNYISQNKQRVASAKLHEKSKNDQYKEKDTYKNPEQRQSESQLIKVQTMVEQRDLKLRIMSSQFEKLRQEKDIIEHQQNTLSESNKTLTRKILNLMNIEKDDKVRISDRIHGKGEINPETTNIYNNQCKDVIHLLIEFQEHVQFYFENKGTTTWACFQRILELYNRNIPLLTSIYNSKQNTKMKSKKVLNDNPEKLQGEIMDYQKRKNEELERKVNELSSLKTYDMKQSEKQQIFDQQEEKVINNTNLTEDTELSNMEVDDDVFKNERDNGLDNFELDNDKFKEKEKDNINQTLNGGRLSNVEEKPDMDEMIYEDQKDQPLLSNDKDLTEEDHYNFDTRFEI